MRLNANLEIHNSFERFQCISVDHDSENDNILIADFEEYKVSGRKPSLTTEKVHCKECFPWTSLKQD